MLSFPRVEEAIFSAIFGDGVYVTRLLEREGLSRRYSQVVTATD